MIDSRQWASWWSNYARPSGPASGLPCGARVITPDLQGSGAPVHPPRTRQRVRQGCHPNTPPKAARPASGQKKELGGDARGERKKPDHSRADRPARGALRELDLRAVIAPPTPAATEQPAAVPAAPAAPPPVVTAKATRQPKPKTKRAKVKGAKRSGSQTRKKQHMVTTAYDDEEFAELDAAAVRAGLTRASFQRVQSLAAPKTRSTRRVAVEREMLAKALGQLGKIGSNLNQIAHDAHLEKLQQYELHAAVIQLRATLPLLLEALGRKT